MPKGHRPKTGVVAEQPFHVSLRPLRVQRLILGVPVRRLAQAIGVSEFSLYRYENGTTIPTIDQMIGLSRALGVPITDLYDVKDGQKA